MRMYDVIAKKRDGGTLNREEMAFAVNGFVTGQVPDYQMSALLMAIYLKGMTGEETAQLTDLMAHSGKMADLSSIQGVKVDKHSTGGVGDKTTLVVAPVVAACGVKVAKMSGRGLGHTGGTADKLESIPGMRIDLSPEEFTAQINKIGCAMIGQTGELCPADKKLYALRDVTGTVESVPLIASSIMSKKIASGAERILLDVKTGSGAFMKTTEDAIALAKEMVEIAKLSGRRAAALITDMDRPLGHAVGNTLEVLEVLETLHGRGPEDLTEECLELAANMIWLGEQAESLEHARKKAKTALETGKAFEKFCEMAEAQGADVRYLREPERFALSPVRKDVCAPRSGYVVHINAEQVGMASVRLGAGREKADDMLDYGAGIVLKKTVGDAVQKGEVIAELYGASAEKCRDAESVLHGAFRYGNEKTEECSLVLARVE